MVSGVVRAVMESLEVQLRRRLGRRCLQLTSLRFMQQCLALLEELADANPIINWHVHLSEFGDNDGKFWKTVREDAAVVDSVAERVLGEVYRFVECASYMTNSAAILLCEPMKGAT